MRLKKKLEKYIFYFFAGASILLVVLGISRVKGPAALSADSSTDDLGIESQQNNQEASIIGAFSTPLENSVLGASETISAEGKLYSTPWGNVGTTIQVKDGKIVGVDISTLPDSPPSVSAKSILIQEALKAGGANIQSVTGATITSKAFIASLENALSIASSKKGGKVAKQTQAQTSANPTTSSIIKKVVSALAPTPATTTPAKKVTPTPTDTITTSGVSGTFVGNAISTPWGNAVASITLVNGTITAVAMPQVPDSPPSVYAEPYLVEQALAAGSANIQGVSGATIVSDAFKTSLESALTKSNGQSAPAQATPSTPAAKPKVPLTPAQLAAQSAPSGLSGIFTGTSYATPWGYASAEITLKNGKITGVSMPQVPNSSPSLYAQSFLIAQALEAGNSNIQGVSGATVVTDAFKLSLESAIAAARSMGSVSIPAAPAPAPALVATPTATQPTTPPAATAPATVNGTFNGTPFSTKWGNAAVSVTFTNGVITGVTMPQIPNSPPSVDAAPFLVGQALSAGSANIQGVSGATVVSTAFKRSLESAIVAASSSGAISTPTPSTTVTTPATTTTNKKKHRSNDDD